MGPITSPMLPSLSLPLSLSHDVLSPLSQSNCSISQVGMQVRIRTNSLEFEFAPNSHEFVDPSEFEFATSNSNSPLIRLKSPEA